MSTNTNEADLWAGMLASLLGYRRELFWTTHWTFHQVYVWKSWCGVQ